MEIIFDDVCLNYNGRVILDHLSYSFCDGIYILQGKSGIGKTSMLNLVMGYIECQQGEIRKSRNVKTGYVFQEDLLFHNLTVRENLWIKYKANSHPNKSFDEMIEQISRSIPIESLLNQYVKYLSGGEKQWIQIAIASMEHPDIILLDEPFAKLDDENKEIVMNFIRTEWSEKLVIIVCHGIITRYAEITYLELRQGKLYEK